MPTSAGLSNPASIAAAYVRASSATAASRGSGGSAASTLSTTSRSAMIGEYPRGVYAPAVRWPWSKTRPGNLTSISSPLVAQLLAPGGGVDVGGIVVGEHGSMGLSAFFRAVSLITGTLASLPLPTYTEGESGRVQVPSIFDNPDTDDGVTPYEWKETAFSNLIMWGRCGAIKMRTAAGGLGRLQLRHPATWCVVIPSLEEYASIERPRAGVRFPAGGLWFDVVLDDGRTVRYDAADFWYVPGLSLDGKLPVSLLTYARVSLATSIAGDRSQANMFTNGALISGLATPADEYDITDDVPEIRRQLNSAVLGHENAGTIAVINRKLNFTPWTMTAVDAQFLGSRMFQIEEISRWTGVPPHLLMQTDKQTSWGTGVDEQNRGLSKFVLGHWASRVEQRGSRVVGRPRWIEFDFAGLERPNFETQVGILLKQTGNKPILTQNEARKSLNLERLDGGDTLEGASGANPV